MSLCRPTVLMALPQSLERQLDIVRAARALAVHDNDSLVLKRREQIAALRRDIAWIALMLEELKRACDPRLRSHVVKYSSDQPRVPAGNPGDRVSRIKASVALSKASPDDPEHPGWPAGTPGGKGGQFRPKDEDASASAVGSNAAHLAVNRLTCRQAYYACLRSPQGDLATCQLSLDICMNTGLDTIFHGGFVGRKGG